MKKILIALCLIASPVWAEKINVRSGDHEAFSRLVFDIPPDLRWEVIQGENYVQIAINRENIHFNLDKIFHLIPRTRILDVQEEVDGSSVRVEMAHGVFANYFSLGDGSLVLDVGTGFEKIDEHTQPSEKPAQNSFGEGEVAAFTPFYQRSPSPLLSPQEDVKVPEENLASGTEANTRMHDAELNLIYQIGRAASQNLIEIDQSMPESPEIKPEIEFSFEARTSTQRLPRGEQNFAMDAKTTIDRDNLSAVGASQLGVRCLSDEELYISAWLDDAPIIEQVSHARRQLLGEFDAPSPDAVEKLAKVYIAAGFGAEANALLTAMPVSGDQFIILKTLAAIVDNTPIPVGSDLAKMTDCDTNAALWGLLASDAPPSDLIVNFLAVKRAFSELPSHLRAQLGPRTIDRLLSLGAIDVAESIRSSLARSPDALDEIITLADYQFPESIKSTYEAADALIPLMASNKSSGHEALLRYIETSIKNRDPIDDETIQNAAALAYENRGRIQESSFLRANILGLGSVGKFKMAFYKLQAWPEESNPALRRGTVHELFRQLSEISNDRVFLTEYFSHEKLAIDSDLPTDVILSLADRLANMGFSSPSEDILSENIKRSERGRILLARAAIIDGHLSDAISHAKDIKDPEGLRLLATAHSLSGDHDAAREAFERLNDYESSSREAWRSGNFEYTPLREIGKESTPPNHFMINDENNSKNTDLGFQPEIISLDQARKLLDLSKTDRDSFSSLLLQSNALYDN